MKVKGQLGMDETLIEDTELEEALEARHSAQGGALATARRFREADGLAKGLIDKAIPVGTVARIGRFRVARKASPGHHVEFDAKAGIRTRIDADGEQ